MHNMTQREQALESLLTKAYTLLVMCDQIGLQGQAIEQLITQIKLELRIE